MPYTVTLDTNTTITIPDNTLLKDGGESTLPIALVGKGINWGEAVQCNLIHILENFYAQKLPSNPTEGMFWFDGEELRVYTNTGWMRIELNTNVGPIPSGANFTAILTGKSKFGETLTATITNPSLTFTTEWFINGVQDKTIIGNTLTTDNSYVGKTVRVRCLVINDQQITEYSDSTTLTISTTNPVQNFTVVLSGTKEPQQLLTSLVSNPIYDDNTPANPTYSIEWLLDNVIIPDFSSNTYTTRLVDAGYTVSARYSFNNRGGILESAVSNGLAIAKIPLTWSSTIAKSGNSLTGSLVVSSSYPIFKTLNRKYLVDYGVNNMASGLIPLCSISADKTTATIKFDGTADNITSFEVVLYDEIFTVDIKAVNILNPSYFNII